MDIDCKKDKVIAVIIFTVFLAMYSFICTKLGRGICIFYNITGMPCPSCGMTRAWLYFISGNMVQAFFYHPLFLSVSLIPLLLIKRLHKFNKIIVIVFITVFLLVWIIRIVTLFPYTPPMNYDKSALIPFIVLKLIKG